MDIGTVGIVIIVASGIVSFALGRYFSNKRREKKDAQKRAADMANQSRQVRRARERKEERGRR
ncbi:hypothetical protein [Variovorax soli]|uniref:hypothetical protein n=1 Tax=Variovorax soli TaxID=376815 RepID=UPI00083949BF|nr:hypothetical protein [Variovorax soli]